MQGNATRYMTGFGGHFETEAVEGALPKGRNSPQRPAFGLYAEQLSGTSFTAPRHDNRRSWLYRMRPTADHRPFERYEGAPLFESSDRYSSDELAPIPSLLLTSAVHHHLIRETARTQVGLIIECGDAREVHHMALLLGYGAGAINPYLALESIDDMINHDIIQGIAPRKARRCSRAAPATHRWRPTVCAGTRRPTCRPMPTSSTAWRRCSSLGARRTSKGSRYMSTAPRAAWTGASSSMPTASW